MIVFLHSVSEERCKVHSILLLSDRECIAHWNMFLCQRSACFQCKRDKETGWSGRILVGLCVFCNKQLMGVTDNLSSWAIVYCHPFEWPYSTLASQARAVVRLQRILWVIVDRHVLKYCIVHQPLKLKQLLDYKELYG